MKLGYILKKLLESIILLFIVVTLIFFLPRMMYSDPATPYYAGVAEDAVALRAAIRAEYGFDRSVFIQYLIFLRKVITFDLGTSYLYKEPVFNVIFARIPWSLVLSFTSLIISVFLGIIFGAVAAKHRGKWQDGLVLKLSTLTTAIPSFWLAMMSVLLFAFILPVFPYRGAMAEGYTLSFNAPVFFGVFAGAVVVTVVLAFTVKKGWLNFTVPLAGLMLALVCAVPFDDIADVAYHAFLPVVIICVGSVISYALLVRNSMISVVNEDYILTAKAKGVPKKAILFKHTFKNALLPLVTNIGLSASGLIGGSVLLEQIFSWPGAGQLLLDATNGGDYPLAQAIMLLFAVVTILANFITDLIYHKLDPRVKAL